MDSRSSDEARTRWSMVVAQIWRSDDSRRKVLADPKAALQEMGVSFPPGTEVRVLEDTEEVTWVPLPRDLDLRGAAPALFAHLFDNLLPLPEGRQVRLVQDTETTRYLVIPLRPRTMQPGELTEAELEAVAGGGGDASDSIFHGFLVSSQVIVSSHVAVDSNVTVHTELSVQSTAAAVQTIELATDAMMVTHQASVAA